MRPQLHKLPLISDTSFLYNNWHCDYFDKPWHFHEEYELVTIDKSKGTKFIGDKVDPFEEGELMLIGPRVPHFFRNNAEYYKKNGELEASSIFIHFTENFLGNNFFDLPEMKLVRKLLENSRFALEIHGNIGQYIIGKLHEMRVESSPQRLVSLLDILIKLSESSEVNPVLSSEFEEGLHHDTGNPRDTSRINFIFEYIMTNFHREIYVHEIADILHMSDASFSRYFKHHTRKTFSDYVTEIRISHACKLLMMDDQSISQVSFDSGFENLSNFYKHFRRITGIVPKEYRRRFLQARA
jgi:AraC-like DNA-binding protein